MKRGGRRWVLALVGGIAGRVARHIERRIPKGTEVRRFASAKEGGTGKLRQILASIKGGGIDEVWILRWIGHSESDRIVQACRKRGIPYLLPNELRRAKKHRK